MIQRFHPLLTRLVLGLSLVIISSLNAVAGSKATLLVPLDEEPTWRDMAYLAAIPAAEKANPVGASLIALEPNMAIGPEMGDYLRRYKPDSVYLLTGAEQPAEGVKLPDNNGAQVTALSAASSQEAALLLSRTFWQASETVVICKDDEYQSALMAAPLAALLKAPLLFASDSGVSPATETELKRLGAKRVLSIGSNLKVADATNLAGAEEVMKWAKEQGIDVAYIAAVNPLDRAKSKLKKMSMVGAQLAAGRDGLVAPLPFDVQWKKPFKSQEPEKELPEKFRNQKPACRTGVISVGSASVPYILCGKPGGSDPTLFIDREGSGNFTGPMHSGDSIELDGREWTVSLGIGSSFHDADVHITWPRVDVVKTRLEEYYKILDNHPEHLCLVGLPDAIPQSLVRGNTLSSDIATDLPYAMIGEEKSSRIGVGRVVAEHVSFGSLYAARVLTYQDLLDDTWAKRACQAEWENTLAPAFTNAGFDASYRLTDEDIPFVEPPSKGKKGKRATSFKQDSPLASAKLLAHSNHSWNFELGSMMKWDATVLMAPTIVESGGCGTTSLDRSAPGQAITEGATGAESPELATKHRSVVSRLFRLGAVSFSGGSREMMAENLPIRQEFWNGVLSGKSVGASHRQGQNISFLILKELGEGGDSYAYWHTLHANTLLGDPAVSIKPPGQPLSAPAKTELDGNRLIVHAPAKWESVKMFVPPDWKKWAKRDLFVVRGAGAFSLNSWGPEERDVETPLVKAEFRSDKKIKSLTLCEAPEKPFGWSGVWHTDRNRDGSYTHRFALRMIDFDQETGKVTKSLDRLEFDVTFE
ncbi:MAG: hypothetical protein ACKO2G_04715 [Verrucomicrobiales bacterium]